jgi:hypothetical protein
VLRVDDIAPHRRGTLRKTFSITPESRLDLAARSPESEAHCLVHQTSHLVDDWGLRRPIPGTPHVPRDGAILSAALSSDGGRHTFLVCLVAFAGRLDQIRGLILAGPERCTQQLRDTRVP